MSDQKVTPLKGFRTPPAPTKGQVLQENATLAQQLTQQMQSMQSFYGNILNQLVKQGRDHTQELQQTSIWLASKPTEDGALKGDNLLMDYAGVVLKDDESFETLTLSAEGKPDASIPSLFDGGNGEMFILTRLGSGTLIPGFEEQLVGLKSGEGKEIIVQFPKEYNPASLAEKKAKFYVYVHEVRRSYATSPVGDLIQSYNRLKAEMQAKTAAESAAAAVESAPEVIEVVQPEEVSVEAAQAEVVTEPAQAAEATPTIAEAEQTPAT